MKLGAEQCFYLNLMSLSSVHPLRLQL